MRARVVVVRPARDQIQSTRHRVFRDPVMTYNISLANRRRCCVHRPNGLVVSRERSDRI